MPNRNLKIHQDCWNKTRGSWAHVCETNNPFHRDDTTIIAPRSFLDLFIPAEVLILTMFAGSYPCHLSLSINLLTTLNFLQELGTVTGNMNHFSFHNIFMIGIPNLGPDFKFRHGRATFVGNNHIRGNRLDVFLFPTRT